jgi:hypothetical protein
VRAVERAAVEDARLSPVEHALAEEAPERVIRLVAEDRRRGEQPQRRRQLEQPEPAQRADDEEQRVARQERHHDDAGLDEDHDEQQQVDPVAVVRDELREIEVDMQREVEQCQ